MFNVLVMGLVLHVRGGGGKFFVIWDKKQSARAIGPSGRGGFHVFRVFITPLDQSKYETVVKLLPKIEGVKEILVCAPREFILVHRFETVGPILVYREIEVTGKQGFFAAFITIAVMFFSKNCCGADLKYNMKFAYFFSREFHLLQVFLHIPPKKKFPPMLEHPFPALEYGVGDFLC